MPGKAMPGQTVGDAFAMGRIRLHGGYDFRMDKDTPKKRAKVELEDRSVRDYHQKGTPPKSKIPDRLPGVFD